MNPFDISERTDRAIASVPAAFRPQAPSAQEYAAARVSPPDQRLVQQIDALSARVEILEKRLRSLGQCAVQQYFDGRLHLPAGRLTILVGGTELVLDATQFTVTRNGTVIVTSRHGTPGMSAPPPSGLPAGGSSLQQMAGGGGAGDWQSIAAANGTDNPRQLTPGQLIDVSHSP